MTEPKTGGLTGGGGRGSLYASPLRLTETEYLHLEREFIGVCRACRHRQGPLEGDAYCVRCESCGMEAVDGIESLLECGHVEVID